MILDLWNADDGRRTDLFRQILRAGIKSLYELGDIPPDMARKARLHKHFHTMPAQPAAAMLPYPPPYQGVPQAYPHPAYLPQEPDAGIEPVAAAPPRPEPQRPEPRILETATAQGRPDAAEPVLSEADQPAPVQEPATATGGSSDILSLMGRGARKKPSGA